jgi:hypothetical protein
MRVRTLAALAAAVLLGGCAPQLYFANGPLSCSPMQQSAYHRTRVMATTQRIQALQARFSMSSRYVARSSSEGWKQAATGECR